MNVLFLDVDGVLNSEAFYHRHSPIPRPPLDRDAVALLDGLVRDANAAVVVSSAWRGHPLLGTWLRTHGFGGQIVGQTPRLSGLDRGAEIAAWLLRHGRRVERFAILDDDDDMGPLADRLVRCDWRVGLTPECCNRVAALLRA